MDFKSILALAADGHEFNRQEAECAFDIIMSGDATPSQIGAFLMSLRMRGETVTEIAAAATVMRAKALRVAAPADAIDIVGTGGDMVGTVNVSTMSSFAIAARRRISTCELRFALRRHSNRGNRGYYTRPH